MSNDKSVTLNLSSFDLEMIYRIMSSVGSDYPAEVVGNLAPSDYLSETTISMTVSFALTNYLLSLGLDPLFRDQKPLKSKRDILMRKGKQIFFWFKHRTPAELKEFAPHFESLIHINKGNAIALLRYMEAHNMDNAMTAVNSIVNDYLKGGTHE